MFGKLRPLYTKIGEGINEIGDGIEDAVRDEPMVGFGLFMWGSSLLLFGCLFGYLLWEKIYLWLDSITLPFGLTACNIFGLFCGQ